MEHWQKHRHPSLRTLAKIHAEGELSALEVIRCQVMLGKCGVRQWDNLAGAGRTISLDRIDQIGAAHCIRTL